MSTVSVRRALLDADNLVDVRARLTVIYPEIVAACSTVRNQTSSAAAEIARVGGHCRSRSFKVIDFGTNRKPVCDFLSSYRRKVLTYILSRTFCQLQHSIGQIIALTGGGWGKGLSESLPNQYSAL